MWKWLMQRRKMLAGGFVSALTLAALTGIEQALGFTFDEATKGVIVATVTGWAVERIPNAE